MSQTTPRDIAARAAIPPVSPHRAAGQTGRLITSMTRRKLFHLSWSAATFTIFALVGWLFTASMARYGESLERKHLTALASTAAAVIESNLVASLKGNGDDVGSPTFEAIRAELQRIHGAVPNIRFVYLMTERAGKWLFLADAEDVGSPDYSPPGQVYDADTTVLHDVLTSGTAAIDGPQHDAWGVWVSGIAPIVDRRTGKAIAVVGMDVRADEWLDTINHYRQLGAIMVGLVLTIVALFLVGLCLKTRHVAVLKAAIADRQRAEAELELANTVLAAARESSLDGILVVDAQARILSFNGRFLDLFQVPAELVAAGVDEPVLRHVTSLVKDPAAFVAGVVALYEDREKSSNDRLELADGRVFDRHSTPLFRDNGDHLGRIWFFRDVTERVTTEEAVRRSEEKYRNLVETTSDYIWEADENIRYTYVSPAVRGLLGYEPEEIVGKTLSDFMRVSSEFDPITAARQPFSQLENSTLRKDGIEIVLESSGVPIFDQTGLFKGYCGIDRDITARKQAEAATAYRGILLHALAEAGRELVTAATADDAVPRALQVVGEAVQADRVAVLENVATDGGPAVPVFRHGWHSPAAPVLDADRLASGATPEIAADPWFAPLAGGQWITNTLSRSQGPMTLLLQSLGIKSILVVPLMIDGKLWGQIGFDDCHGEREWRMVEIDILRALADMVGTAMMRARYVQELSDANVIIVKSPTILYRLRGEPALPMIYVSQNIRLFGYDPAAMVASPEIYKAYVHPEDMAKVRTSMVELAAPNSLPAVVEFRMLTADGEYRWVENHYTPVHDHGGRLVEVEGILIDVTERKAAEDKIALLARTDALTGLANRTTFIERLRQSFAAARHGAPPFAVFYLDLDHFKDINDTLGHPAGDELLKAVAERIQCNLRANDLLARLGGDEFTILQVELTDPAASGALAQRLRGAIAAPYRIAGSEVHITASVGISLYTPDTAKPEDMLAQGDLALYRAKDEGRDQYRFHTETLDAQVRERVALAEELRGAIERNEFELHYQPQVRLDSHEIVGIEVLIRWRHPTRGLLMPREFLDTAERAGIMVALGGWVLDHACQQMSEWRRGGIAPPILAVNLSLMQLRAGREFVDAVAQTLARWGLVPAQLELDVTESMLAHATLVQSDVLDQLQRLGVQMAIDDFGAQYSSLDYLRTYRVSRIKIPRLMIGAATQDPSSAAMVRAIIDIAHELNVDVIAQGVETKAQHAFLSETATARMAQGFYYCQPVSADRATELLRQKVIEPPVAIADCTDPVEAKHAA